MTRVSFTYMGNHLNLSHGVPFKFPWINILCYKVGPAIYKWSYNIVITPVYMQKNDTSFSHLYLDTSRWKLLNQWLGSMRSQQKRDRA